MLEQVQAKINELQKLQAEEYYKKKEADLREWGLVAKKENGKTTPIVVTDEEYNALIKASNGVGKSGRNSVAVLLNALSLSVVVVAAIAGFVLESLSDELGFVYMSLCFVVGIVFAALLKGVAEAVRLIQQLIDEKPIQAPTEVARRTDVAVPHKVMAVPGGEFQQGVAVQEQTVVYHQVPQSAPQQPAYQQIPYQPVMYQQAPYQGIPQQPVYQQVPYQPTYSVHPFEDGFAHQENAPKQFDN